MSAFKKILVIEDVELGKPVALKRAIELAKAARAEEVCVFTCGYTPVIETAVIFNQEAKKKAKQSYLARSLSKLNTLIKPYQDSGVNITTDCQWSKSVAQGVLDKVESYRPDLLVLHNHHHGPLTRLLSNYTEWELVKRCPVPLLLVRLEDSSFERPIMVGVDTLFEEKTSASYQATAHALALAHLLEGALRMPLHVVHCYQAYDQALAISDEGLAELQDKAKKIHEDNLKTLMQERGLNPEALHFLTGPVVEELIQYADRIQAQMLVLGNTRKSLVEKFVLGATLQALLEHAHCDVLVVNREWGA